MPVERLLRAVERFLEEERTVLAAAPDAATADAVAHRLAAARRELERAAEAATVWERTPKPFRKVLVAIDESHQAEWALDLGVRLAVANDAELGLVHVVPEPGSVAPELAYAEPTLRAQRRDMGEALLREVATKVPPGTTVRTFLHEGAAPSHICAAAKDWGADVLVIGTHGRGLLGRLLLGGTAESVVRHAGCPVLTVAHPPTPMSHLSEDPAVHAEPELAMNG
jgi:nucleotide-binding universal stress UspA family protein